MINFLVKLSENDRRILLVVFFIVIILLVFLGMIYDGIRAFMRHESTKVDTLMTRSVKSGLISGPKVFRSVARQKSQLEFYRVYRLTFLIGLVAFAIYGVCSLFYGHWINFFDYTTEGVFTLFFKFNWQEVPTTTVFGITVMSDFPPVISSPNFTAQAIPSYVITPFVLYFIGATIYQVLGLIARSFRIPKLAQSMFKLDLDNAKLDDISDSSPEVQAKGINKPTVS